MSTRVPGARVTAATGRAACWSTPGRRWRRGCAPPQARVLLMAALAAGQLSRGRLRRCGAEARRRPLRPSPSTNSGQSRLSTGLARVTSGLSWASVCACPGPVRAGLEPHRHHAVAGALHPAVPEPGVDDVVADAPDRRRIGGVGRATAGPAWWRVGRVQRLVEIGEQRLLPDVGQPRKANADKANRADLDRIEQQPARGGDQRGGVGGGVRQRRRPGQRAHVRLLQLDGDRARAAAVALQALVRVLADRAGGLAQLVERGEVRGEGRLGADLLGSARSATGRSSMPRASRCSAGPIVAPRTLATSESLQRGQRADGVDAQPVQPLLGHRADPPQPAHRQPGEQRALLVATDDADAVGFGQPRRDLGDLLARAGADRGDQPGLAADPRRAGPRRTARPHRRPRRPVRPARRTPRRTTAVRAPGRPTGRCRARARWPRRRPRRAAAAPPRPRRPAGAPGASASPTWRRTRAPRSWPPPPRRGRRARRPAPAVRAAWAGSAARRRRRTRPCRSAGPSAHPLRSMRRGLA